jgi:hypothetical protein
MKKNKYCIQIVVLTLLLLSVTAVNGQQTEPWKPNINTTREPCCHHK